MKLTESGKIARRFLLEIPKHFQNVFLDKWIIMPNHIRGIIVIEKADGDIKRRNEALPRSYNGEYKYFSKISPKPNSLSTIIGSFKSICTRRIHLMRN
ncbi:hypothetical protein COY23_01910 [bacterium (Candidatus Torokbacteria) CG_4_10_14_0_2_um_filter_35_8]|nr:MAG: hypothetical protein COY23_01910 [bacterium (Candidatus Torokbacteria) CG_4_10_14_0_2_um_filter_35_8]